MRARDAGIPFDGTPGERNAISDVAGLEVGMTTLIEGDGPLVVGSGPVRTGVTVILPRGRGRSEPCFAGWSALNGNGEMTGTTWIDESGLLEGPVALTNTHSVGVVRDALVEWCVRERLARQPWVLPVVAETYDGYLNDINGFHVRREHVFAALNGATPQVVEGSVGGGTGMICHGFKGGTGTSSRRVVLGDREYVVGVLVQANHGRREELRIAGVPVGRELGIEAVEPARGSIIAVVATDAPLLPHQLRRVAKRPALGIARCGSIAANSSGDIFIALSTAGTGEGEGSLGAARYLPDPLLTAVFEAAVEATEEAIVNALVAAGTMIGIEGRRVSGLPIDGVREILRRYGRLESAS